jgi:glycosyltransferase involved in cell wall biosynthesis
MATYSQDVPEQLFDAGRSIFEQTRVPDELVIVLDGPVSDAHEEVIKRIGKLGPLRVVRLHSSVGPGMARHFGILACTNSIVAIMDADDLCVAERFEKQIALLEAGAVDVVGGWIREFERLPGDSNLIRRVPLTQEEIMRFAKLRSPMNNVTVMFRKKAYLQAGGYSEMRCLEDYDLFARMLRQGAQFRNIPEVLVEVRGGLEMIKRRGGWSQIPIESAMLFRMYSRGFISFGEFLLTWFIRATACLIPSVFRKFIYQKFLRS